MQEIGKIILMIIAVIVIAIGSQSVATLTFQEKYPQAIFAEFLRFTSILLVYWVFNKYFWNTNFSQTNFVTDFQEARWIYRGLILGTALILSTYSISYFTGAISIHPTIGTSADFLTYASVIFLTMLSTAIWEELVFRSVVLGHLSKIMGPNLSSILVAAIFGLMHLLSPVKSWQMVASTFFAGLLLNYAFLNSQNLWFAISVHFSWNYLNSLLYSKKFMGIEYIKPILAGNKNPEEGYIAMTITFLGFLFAFFTVTQWKITSKLKN